jgi:predicted transcriptional regulator
VQVSDLSKLIGEVHRALTSSQAGTVEPRQEPLTPGLPHDYPMVAPNYAQARSALAKKMGLGQKAGRRKS